MTLTAALRRLLPSMATGWGTEVKQPPVDSRGCLRAPTPWVDSRQRKLDECPAPSRGGRPYFATVPTRPCGFLRTCVFRRTSKKSGFASRETACSLRPSSPTGSSFFALDTDISSYIIKRRPATLVEQFQKHAESLCVSVMTAAELRFGAEKAGRPQLTELVEAYLSDLQSWTGPAKSVDTMREFAPCWSAQASLSGTWTYLSPVAEVCGLCSKARPALTGCAGQI
jgi:hypothetical protein